MVGPRKILLHIGPPKTATTSIQQLLNQHGSGRSDRTTEVLTQRDAVLDLVLDDEFTKSEPMRRGGWEKLVSAINRSHAEIVIVSDEKFSWLDSSAIAEVARAFGAERTQVVFGARALYRVIPSYWQELLKVGVSDSLHAWCAALLQGNAHGERLRNAGRFWRSQDLGALAERWSSGFGKRQVSCFVVDENDHARTLQNASEALGLKLLVSEKPAAVSNLSLSLQRARALQRVNEMNVRMRVPARVRRAITRLAVEQLSESAVVRGARAEVPQEFLQAVRARQERMVELLQTSGIRVVGDLSTLMVGPTPEVNDDPRQTLIDDRLRWSRLLVGVCAAALRNRARNMWGRIDTRFKP